MNELGLSLQPFLSEGPVPGIKINCGITRTANIIAVSYELHGSEEIIIPAPSDVPLRKKDLWNETCLELFLGVKDSPRYWEFNLSPSGHWNVFRFDTYRQGMQEEMSFVSLPFTIENKSDSLALHLKFDPGKIVRTAQPLEASVSAVIKQRNGTITYWALNHHSAQADFHRRDSFIVRL